MAAVKPIRELLESHGPPIVWRKLNGILNALEMQVEDGRFQVLAVTRLCEALLASAELYPIGKEAAGRLEQLTNAVIERVSVPGA